MSACADRLASPCHRPPVSSLRPRICLVGRSRAPSQPQTAPTPRRCGRSKDQRTNQVGAGLCHLGRYGGHFCCVKGCPKASKKTKKRQTQDNFGVFYSRNIQWAIKSDRPDPVSGPTSLHAHNGAEQRPPLRTPSCDRSTIICDTKKARRTNSNANSI